MLLGSRSGADGAEDPIEGRGSIYIPASAVNLRPLRGLQSGGGVSVPSIFSRPLSFSLVLSLAPSLHLGRRPFHPRAHAHLPDRREAAMFYIRRAPVAGITLKVSEVRAPLGDSSAAATGDGGYGWPADGGR